MLTCVDSSIPPLNPYFTFAHNQCTGIWSDTIVTEMARARPEATFYPFAPAIGELAFGLGDKCPKTRPMSIKVSTYKMLSCGVTIE